MNRAFVKTVLVVLLAGVVVPAHAQERAATDGSATQSTSPADSATENKPKEEPVVIAPEPVVVVTTASRGPAIGDPSAATTVIGEAQIESAPAQTPDQLLHDVPVIALPETTAIRSIPPDKASRCVGLAGANTGSHRWRPPQ